eukprot:2638733-Pleurochrysis_carterae.AAC.2
MHPQAPTRRSISLKSRKNDVRMDMELRRQACPPTRGAQRLFTTALAGHSASRRLELYAKHYKADVNSKAIGMHCWRCR